MTRLLATLLLISLLGVPVSAAADDGTTSERTEPLTATVTPGAARPGDTVEVVGSGWPAYTQVQAVVCGDLAIGGSSTCDQTGAILATASEDGLLELDLPVGKPPQPCPCVVHVAAYQGPTVAVDAPFSVIGHPIGTPPQPDQLMPRLEVTGVRLEGGGGIGAWFGAAGKRQLVVTVENVGNAPMVDPPIRLGVGKSAAAEPTVTDHQDLTIQPLQSAEVDVTVGLPFAAFGDYRVVGVVGADDVGGRFQTTWSAYPWGLIALNVLGLVLLVWGIRRRLTARRRGEAAERAARHRATVDAYALPDVVYVEALGGFLVSPRAASRSRVLRRVGGRLDARDLAALLAGGTPLVQAQPLASDVPPVEAGAAVVDLAAVERWLTLRGSRARGWVEEVLESQTPKPATSTDAVVDVDAVDRWLERRDSLKGSA